MNLHTYKHERSKISDLFTRLPRRAQRGSKPRCHLLTHGSAEEVAARLTGLIAPWGCVDPQDHRMPQGFECLKEARLGEATGLLNEDICHALRSWWLAKPTPRANTPNWDVASTCTIEGKKGLLLIEAKAHDEELRIEEKGKPPSTTENGQRNHERIGTCILSASVALTSATGLQWNLSRDRNYQMSNRFAWAWELTELGISVILVYLGFLNADEMHDRGKPFVDGADWQQLVRTHSQRLFPLAIWDHQWKINGQTFVPLIKAIEWPLNKSSLKADHNGT